ncbi:hypothetical protein F0U62_20995 [Cystobacter fuscus]|uniref:hypothetical protein n=1 Tax=Cystobacter fuscus TaxID=43 RepID=UPI002B2B2DCB|nr:hypothetical protein F0U62_20995 [Cystobacter fuscus]
MSLRNNGRLSRREILKALSMCAAGSAMGPLLTGCRDGLNTPAALEQLGGVRQARLDGKPRFLIVVGAVGGASIVDSMLAVRASETTAAGGDARKLNTFADAQVQNVDGSPFRAVKVEAGVLGSIPMELKTDQLPFVKKYKDSMLVATSTGTSVNHVIAQKRSLTGSSAWRGRTLQECVALQYGAGFPLPNVNMGNQGFSERGSDNSLPAYCYGEVVAKPSFWPLGLDGMKGIKDLPSRDVVNLTRVVRNSLDSQSVFGKTFDDAAALDLWNAQRTSGQSALEMQELIGRLNMMPDNPETPLSEYGLSSSPDAERLRAVFPNYLTDPVEGQAALAFLLIKHRVSVTVTLGPTFNIAMGSSNQFTNPPLAFDFSHNEHRSVQAFMWSRLMETIDKLIELLKSEPFDSSGESLWDRSLIYMATEFGRTRTRQEGATRFGTGHDLNNGFMILSPRVRGNTVLGGVDPKTTLTYGFDPRTGAPQPGKMEANEADIFSGILTAMGVDTSGSGLPDASAFLRT